MKYFLIQTKISKKFANYLFPVNDARKLASFYLKLKTLFLHDIPRQGNFYLVSDLPRDFFTEWEWAILSKLDNFRLANMTIMTQWELDLVRVINAVGLRKEIRQNLKQYIDLKNSQILKDVRMH